MRPRALSLALLLSALACPALAAGVDFNLFAGVELDSSANLGDLDSDPATGYSLGLEIVVDVPLVKLGGGLEYGFPRDLDRVGSADYEYVYAYGVARLEVLPFLYGVARLGYADVSTSGLADDGIGGSLTWSLGAGLKLAPWFSAEAMYTQFTGDLDADGISVRAVVTF